MMYGPLPAECDRNHCSDLSDWSAPGSLVAPFSLASLLSTTANEDRPIMPRKAGSTLVRVTTTVFGSGAWTPAMLAARKDGWPFRFLSRSSENFTSAELSG